MNKFKILAFTSTVLLLASLVGCSEIPKSTPSSSLAPAPSPSAPQHTAGAEEFGVPELYTEESDSWTVTAFIPKANIPSIDDEISKALQNALAPIKTEVENYRAEHPETEKASILLDYSSLSLEDGRKASILEKGQYMYAGLREPASALYTLNFNLESGALLCADDLFAKGYEPALNTLVTAKLKEQNPNLDFAATPVALSGLTNLQLTKTGAAVYFPKNSLAGATQDMQVDLSASELASLAAPVPTPAPSPPVSQGRSIDPDKPMIAFTFDDGPHGEVTPKLLDLFESYNGRATFCVVGSRVAKHAAVVKRMAADGHQIANHTWTHPKMTELSAEDAKKQLADTNDIVAQVTGGYRIRMYRPTYGAFNDTIKQVTKELEMYMANWPVDSLDWKTRNADAVYNVITAEAKSGRIILCHDLYPTTLAAMERILPVLAEQGYQFVTVDELLSFSDKPVEYGKLYRHR